MNLTPIPPNPRPPASGEVSPQDCARWAKPWPETGAASLTLEFNLPRDTHARLEMYNEFGERVGVLAEGLICRGVHAVDWMTQQRPSGLYTCRLWAEGSPSTTNVFLTAPG